MIEYDQLMSLCNELKEYSDLEGSEIGEICNLLINIAKYHSYTSDPFREALIIELQNQLQNFKENSTISEIEISTPRIEKILDWK